MFRLTVQQTSHIIPDRLLYTLLFILLPSLFFSFLVIYCLQCHVGELRFVDRPCFSLIRLYANIHRRLEPYDRIIIIIIDIIILIIIVPYRYMR